MADLFSFFQDHMPAHNTVDYLSDVLYDAFYCFEALSLRNLDDVVCGLCGIVGEVYFGDGNAKNCCSVAGVSETASIYLH